MKSIPLSRAFSEPYVVERSFTIAPHSISLKTLLFHTENWWNEEDQYFNFRFKDGKSYHVYIGFDNDLVEEKEEALFDLVIYDDADQLVLYNEEGDNWDYWDIR